MRNRDQRLDLQTKANVIALEKLPPRKISTRRGRVSLEARLRRFRECRDGQTQRATRGSVEQRQQRLSLKELQPRLRQSSAESRTKLLQQAEKRYRLNV